MEEKSFVRLYQDFFQPSNDCRKCLMQLGNSIFGDFRLTYHEIDSIAYVLYTSRERQEIIHACLATNVCYKYEDDTQASSDSCEFVHGPQKSLNFRSETPYKQHTSSSGSNNGILKCYIVHVSPEYIHSEKWTPLFRIVTCAKASYIGWSRLLHFPTLAFFWFCILRIPFFSRKDMFLDLMWMNLI